MRPITPTSHRRSVPSLLAFVLAAGMTLFAPAAADAATQAPASWAPADTATIHPGVQMYTNGAQCTANFVFSDGVEVYLGYAAHCAGTGAATDTDGCDPDDSRPLGTPVEIVGSDGTSYDGELAYSSWETMGRLGEQDADACAYNDFALVRITDLEASGQVNPSVPFWGGPHGVDADGTDLGESVYSYGNSSLRLGITALSPKEGTALGSSGGGWTHPVYTVSPGVPGDSGSALLDSEGQATGVLSTLAILPLTGSNNYSDLGRALDYMHRNSTLSDVQLVEGTEAFDGSTL